MKILYIQYANPWNPHSHGGISIAGHELICRLATDHSVTVYTGKISLDTSNTTECIENYQQVSLGGNKWIDRLSFSVRSYLLDLSQFDVVVVPWSRYSPVFSKHRNIIIEAHSNYFEEPSKTWLLEPFTRLILKKKLVSAKRLISVSDSVSKHIRKHCRKAATILRIYNGVDESLFSCPEKIQAKEYFLYIGRLDMKVKGIDLLLRAYKDSGSQAVLIIAGNGPDESKIHNLIQAYELNDKVELIGWVSGEKKLNILSAAKAVILPSRQEGWGLVAIEANAAGTTCIASNIGGLPEAVIHLKTGIIFESENVAALKDAIRAIDRNPELCDTLSRNARERARSFSWDSSARKRIELFKEILDENSN